MIRSGGTERAGPAVASVMARPLVGTAGQGGCYMDGTPRFTPIPGSPTLHAMSPQPPHYEEQYLDLMRHIWRHGDERIDRTGVGTRSILGATLRFSLADDAVPLLTTKRVYWKVAAREMLWFLTGDTNIRELVKQNVHIWTDWPLDSYRKATGEDIDRNTFEARIIEDEAFARQWGDLGPVYGAQWVNWPRYEPAGDGLFRRAAQGHNQIAALVDAIRTNPGSRRLLFTGWNVAEVAQMALPPCHMTYQFQVSDGRLNGLLFQRSCDLGLGFAFNIFGLSMITRMLAQQCDLEPGEVVWQGGDVHLYLNHADLVEEQISRTPAGAPKLRISITTAALGGTITVPGLDRVGHEIRIPAGIQTGKQIRQRGAGMPVLQGRGTGDMVIQIDVETPTRLTTKQKELLREFQATETGQESPESTGFFAKLKEMWDGIGE